MRIQDGLSNCCKGIKDFASSAVNWIGKTVTAAGSFIAERAAKIAEFVKPHFEHLKTFVHENKQPLTIAGVAVAAGIGITLLFQKICGKPTATHATPAPTPVAVIAPAASTPVVAVV
jgi:hypothetical protein